jgi:hypothetical protein
VPGAEVESWGVAGADLGTQRLFRIHVQRGSEDGTLRVALRLAALERFDLRASDPLGRPLWTLTVDGGAGRWAAAGKRQGCRFDPDLPLRLAGLDWGLPVRDLAAALVGRLPEPPDDGNDRLAVDYRDGSGRRWTATRDESGPLRWTLWLAGAPALWWERAERGGRLSASEARLQIRWREVAREPLAGDGPRLAAEDAGEPECDDADLS